MRNGRKDSLENGGRSGARSSGRLSPLDRFDAVSPTDRQLALYQDEERLLAESVAAAADLRDREEAGARGLGIKRERDHEDVSDESPRGAAEEATGINTRDGRVGVKRRRVGGEFRSTFEETTGSLGIREQNAAL